MTVLLELDAKNHSVPCKIYYRSNGITVPGYKVNLLAKCYNVAEVSCVFQCTGKILRKIYIVVHSFYCMHASANNTVGPPLSEHLCVS